jgi:hypothetical protein
MLVMVGVWSGETCNKSYWAAGASFETYCIIFCNIRTFLAYFEAISLSQMYQGKKKMNGMKKMGLSFIYRERGL